MALDPKKQKIIDRIVSKANILINEYLTAKRQYDFYIYSANNENIIKRFDNSYGAHILLLINHIMVVDIIKQLYNIVMDNDNRSVSVCNIFSEIKTHKGLFIEKATEIIPANAKNITFGDGFSEEYKKEFMKKQSEENASDRLRIFHTRFDELSCAISAFKSSPLQTDWREIRHKVASHIDFKDTDGNIERMSFSKYGIEFDDLAQLVQQVQMLVDMTLLTCSSTSHHCDSSDEINLIYAKDFWECFRVGMRYRGGVKLEATQRENYIQFFKKYNL